MNKRAEYLHKILVNKIKFDQLFINQDSHNAN